MPNSDLMVNKHIQPTISNLNTLSDAAKVKNNPKFASLITKYADNALTDALFAETHGELLLINTAINQSNQDVIFLVNKISPAAMNQAISMQNHNKWSPLHAAAQYQSESAFIALINKADASAVNQASLLQNTEKWSPLHLAAWHQSEKAFITFINTIDTQTINHAIPVQNNQKWSLLHTAARYQSENAFIALIEKTDASAINQAILIQNDLERSPLHTAVLYQSEKACIALIEKTDASAINQAILIQNDLKRSPLHTAAQHQSEKAFIALIEKTDASAINQAILIQSDTKCSPLHMAARYQSEQAFITLIEKTDASTINQAILLQNDEKWSVLLMAARNQSEKAFITLIEKTDTRVINQAILLQDNEQWSPLQVAARYQSEKAFIALIEKTDVSAINQVMPLQNDKKISLLFIAAQNQSETAFITLVNKTEKSAINEAILLQNDTKWTPLHVAATYQSEDAFIKLIDKIDNSYFEKSAFLKNDKNKSCFDYLIEYQSSKAILQAFKKISNNLLSGYLSALDNQTLNLLLQKMFESAELTDKILEVINQEVNAFLIKKLENHTEHGLPLIQSLRLEKLLNDKFKSNTAHQNNTFKTSKGRLVSFQAPNLIEILMQEGFYSRHDAGLLLSTNQIADYPALVDAIKELDTFNLLLKGGLSKYHASPLLAPTLHEKIQHSEILYKVIKPENFENYIAQFNDYTLRPNNIRINKPNATHKFHHLTGEIKAYQFKEHHNCGKKAIKKNSTTLLSPELTTPVFGEHHNDDRPLVGLLFDLKQCNIKAMLKHDMGTVNRNWVGTQEEVCDYKVDLIHINHTNLDEFKKITQHSFHLNEVLAEIPKEAILGIFMRNTRLKSKKVALDYANKIKDTLDLDLPIYHYSSIDKAMLPYSKARIKQHLELCPIEIAKNLRHSLLHSTYELRFWGGEIYTAPDKSITKKLPQTAYDIITKIDVLLTENNPERINKKLDNIEALLTTKLKMSLSRTVLTIKSYDDNLQKFKNERLTYAR